MGAYTCMGHDAESLAVRRRAATTNGDTNFSSDTMTVGDTMHVGDTMGLVTLFGVMSLLCQ